MDNWFCRQPLASRGFQSLCCRQCWPCLRGKWCRGSKDHWSQCLSSWWAAGYRSTHRFRLVPIWQVQILKTEHLWADNNTLYRTSSAASKSAKVGLKFERGPRLRSKNDRTAATSTPLNGKPAQYRTNKRLFLCTCDRWRGKIWSRAHKWQARLNGVPYWRGGTTEKSHQASIALSGSYSS